MTTVRGVEAPQYSEYFRPFPRKIELKVQGDEKGPLGIDEAVAADSQGKYDKKGLGDQDGQCGPLRFMFSPLRFTLRSDLRRFYQKGNETQTYKGRDGVDEKHIPEKVFEEQPCQDLSEGETQVESQIIERVGPRPLFFLCEIRREGVMGRSRHARSRRTRP